jgi:hypothetical protein
MLRRTDPSCESYSPKSPLCRCSVGEGPTTSRFAAAFNSLGRGAFAAVFLDVILECFRRLNLGFPSGG